MAGIEGEVTYEQVLAVTNISDLFTYNESIARFNELVYFKNINMIVESGFDSCTLLEEITLPNTVLSGDFIFTNCSSLREVSTPFGLRLLTAYCTFLGCSSLSYIDTSGWDTSGCTNMSCMFEYCIPLSSIDVSGWDMGACTNM